MNLQECAEAIDGKSPKEILELPESFFTEMYTDGLYLAFCSDRMYLHVMGRHNGIIQVNIGENENFNICISEDGKFERCENATSLLPMIKISWGIVEGGSAGYILEPNFDSQQIKVIGDGHACSGIIFSKNAINQTSI